MNRTISAPELRNRTPEGPDGSPAERIWISNASPEKTTMKLLKRLGLTVLGILIALAIGAGIVATKISQFKAMGAAAARQKMPLQPVNVAEVSAGLRPQEESNTRNFLRWC